MKAYFPVLLVSAIFLIACNSGPTDNTGINQKRSEKDSTYNICYTSQIKKDTVLFNGLVFGDSIKGSLGYKLYEKQQQNGHLLGTVRGDTIWGLYTFMASDSVFVNEVTFLKTDSMMIEGIGNRLLVGKKFVFDDTSKVRYIGIKLARTDCRQLPQR